MGEWEGMGRNGEKWDDEEMVTFKMENKKNEWKGTYTLTEVLKIETYCPFTHKKQCFSIIFCLFSRSCFKEDFSQRGFESYHFESCLLNMWH